GALSRAQPEGAVGGMVARVAPTQAGPQPLDLARAFGDAVQRDLGVPPRCALRRYERRAESYDAIGANTRFEFPICPIAELDLPHPRYCRPRRVTPTVRAWFGGGAHLS